ncbi:unnamed protein product [Arctogadus glacialis]
MEPNYCLPVGLNLYDAVHACFLVSASDARVEVTSLWIISSSCSSEYIDMKALIGLLLLVFGHGVSSVLHSMQFFYTGSSGLTTFPEFVAVGMVDGVQFYYYDSNTQRIVLKQDWMEQVTREDPDYLERNTGRAQGNQQWFKVNIGILKKNFNQIGDSSLSSELFYLIIDERQNVHFTFKLSQHTSSLPCLSFSSSPSSLPFTDP